MYTQLASEERYYIGIGLKNGDSIRQIARDIGRSHTTIGREIARNTGKKGYRYQQAQNKATVRQGSKEKAVKMNDTLKSTISTCLQQDWSPEQICGRLKEKDGFCLHHETIYRFILLDKKQKGVLYKHLRHQGKKYRKRYGHPNNRTGIPNRVDIEERCDKINNREVFGHWEADTIIGKGHQGAIVTLDERISKLRMAYPVNSKQACKVAQAIGKVLKPISEWVGSITYDNGKEFAKHEAVNKQLKCLSYFANPSFDFTDNKLSKNNGIRTIRPGCWHYRFFYFEFELNQCFFNTSWVC